MEHFAIVTSLIRVAFGDDAPRLEHQVRRLMDALAASGDARQAASLQKVLDGRSRSVNVAPSRLTTSAREWAGLERLTSRTPIPVDKDSSAPLASVLMPENIHVALPVFPAALRADVDALLMEWTHAEQIWEAGLTPSPSLLVYGAPGTGKTTLALWLARQLGRPVVLARLDGLISSFLGTTARNLGALFDFANRYDCVLVLDEFDAIAKVRDDPNEVGEIKRVVNALLQSIDARAGRGVTIALTNHETLLDPAIWRRFEVQLAVPLPQYEQRVQIALDSLGATVGDEGTLAEARLLAWAAQGLSGAELRTLTAKYRKRRLLSAGSNDSPARTLAQVAGSTSVHIAAEVSELSSLTESAQTRHLYERSFSHSDLAYLYGVSTKTIQRRMSEATSGE